MKITWLGQAGLLMETKGKKIMIDPYLSDSVIKVNPKNWRRKPIDERFLQMQPDILIFTHNHLDHYDPETVPTYLEREQGILVLGPNSCFMRAKEFKGNHNYVKFDRHAEWTEDGIHFTAVLADHSDTTPIGVLIDDGEKTYYITGDTLYNEDIFEDIKGKHIDVLFLPINGVGNNMNKFDAARFAAKVGADKVVPLHFGMFDELSADDFDVPNKVIPEIYQEIKL